MKKLIFTVILILSVCLTAFSTTPFDKYGKISWKDEMPRLFNLGYALDRDKDYKVSLRIYLDKKASKSKVKKRLEKIFSFLTNGKYLTIEKARISFEIFEGSDEERTAYWLMESKVILPECENCQTIKGEDFEQKIKDLFPKK